MQPFHWHLKGLAPLWVRSCARWLELWCVQGAFGLMREDGWLGVCEELWGLGYLCANRLPHPKRQAKGFSPVCVRMWGTRSDCVLKPRPHNWQIHLRGRLCCAARALSQAALETGFLRGRRTRRPSSV